MTRAATDTKTVRTMLAASLALVCAVLCVDSAEAQLRRTWISQHGSDGNTCQRNDPCLSLREAVSRTAAGGEVNVLDSADYSSATIDKSITIDGGEFHAVVFAGVTINAGPNDRVVLRNLKFHATNRDRPGVTLNTGRTLVVENCIFNDLSIGINVRTSGRSNIYVNNVHMTNVNTGIIIQSDGLSASRFAIATINDAYIDSSARGIQVFGRNAFVTVVDSVIYANDGTAIQTVTENPQLNINDSQLLNSAVGVLVDGTEAVIRLTNTSIYENGIGLAYDTEDGLISTTGDNDIGGNDTSAPPNGTVQTQ
jgi:hypothetical protein